MKKIDVNLDFVKNDSHAKFVEYQERVNEIHKMINDRTGEGHDFLGWLNYPNSLKEELLDSIIVKAKEIQENYEVLVVCGIGGSYLGARAAIEAIKGKYPLNQKMEILYLGNTLDANYTYETIEYLKSKKFAVCVISKSGTTTETAVSFRILKQLLEDSVGKDGARKAIVSITDLNNGALRELSTKEGYTTFELPHDIGGRFSVITPVGLFPMACAGIDIKELIEGCKDAEAEYSDPNLNNNEAYCYAIQRNYLYESGYRVEMMISYEPRLKMLMEWWKQLFDESEGKEDKAVLTASCTFTTDLHSLGQFIQEGSKVLYETVLYFAKPTYDITIPYDEENLDGLNYIAGKTLSYVNDKAYIGTLTAHSANAGVPNIRLLVKKMDERTLGHLFYFFMIACAMSAYLLGVNPFNQPGVEVYKKNMFHLLGKKGY
ncbi:MAG TPA: glucose-6-phosphate isomerase [Candidatus Onthovivens sp.]|nr:glucose-6-phosphate isomerase [Candidatus Onthovivens sp.]